MTTAPSPSPSLPLPVFSTRQKLAVLSGWLLLNLMLLAPLLHAPWNEADLASRQWLSDGRLCCILPLLGLAAFLVAWFMKDGAAFWFGVLAVGVEGCAWLLTPPARAWSGAQLSTVFVCLHVLLQIPLFFFVRASAGVAARSMGRIVPLAVAIEVLAALSMPEAWLAGWLAAVAGLWLLLGLWMLRALAGAPAVVVDLVRPLLALSVFLTMLALSVQVASWWGTGTVDRGWMPAALRVLAVSYMLGQVLQWMGAECHKRAAQVALTERLARERAELVDSFERRQQRQVSEAQASERSRLMRELHDGLGSQLVAALALLSTSQPANKAVADLIDLCLQQLRSTLDTLGADCHDVGELLGSFRDRIEPVLEARGISLDWQVQPMPATARLNAGERLHVMRIVQEAFTNILKHSGASQVTLRAETLASGCSLIEVSDNGTGLCCGCVQAPGRGLANMRERAALLRAQLSCAKGEAGGVQVRLVLSGAPFDAAPSNVIMFPGRVERQRNA